MGKRGRRHGSVFVFLVAPAACLLFVFPGFCITSSRHSNLRVNYTRVRSARMGYAGVAGRMGSHSKGVFCKAVCFTIWTMDSSGSHTDGLREGEMMLVILTITTIVTQYLFPCILPTLLAILSRVSVTLKQFYCYSTTSLSGFYVFALENSCMLTL